MAAKPRSTTTKKPATPATTPKAPSTKSKAKSPRKSATRSSAKDTAAMASVVSKAEARDGARRVAAGMDVVDAATDAAAVGRATTIAGAGDLTRGADEVAVSQRVAALGDVVAAAGISDVAQGAELITESEDIELLGAVVGAISEEDLERGLEVARVSGELGAVAIVVDRIGMPVLSAFLADRGDQLLGVSVDAIIHAGGTRAIARALAETGGRVEALGAAGGCRRGDTPRGRRRPAERSEDLAESGAARAFEGYQEMVAGEEIRETAVEAGAAGLSEAGRGMEEIGSAGALADVAEQLTPAKKTRARR